VLKISVAGWSKGQDQIIVTDLDAIIAKAIHVELPGVIVVVSRGDGEWAAIKHLHGVVSLDPQIDRERAVGEGERRIDTTPELPSKLNPSATLLAV
jgi:hypothetical protein